MARSVRAWFCIYGKINPTRIRRRQLVAPVGYNNGISATVELLAVLRGPFIISGDKRTHLIGVRSIPNRRLFVAASLYSAWACCLCWRDIIGFNRRKKFSMIETQCQKRAEITQQPPAQFPFSTARSDSDDHLSGSDRQILPRSHTRRLGHRGHDAGFSPPDFSALAAVFSHLGAKRLYA